MPRTYQRNRQDHIAQVAAQIIGELGPEGATIREIAARCGVSKGVVEHHFSDKTEILRKTMSWANRGFAERVRRRTAKKRGLAAVHEHLRCIVPLTSEAVSEWKLRVHFWSMALASPDEQTRMSARFTWMRERFREDVAQAIELGEVPASVDPRKAANALMHLGSGVACHMLMDPADCSRRYCARIVEKAIEDLRRGSI